MTLDLGRLVARAFSIAWHHRWLWFLGVFGGVGAGYNLGSVAPRGNFRGGVAGAQPGRFLADHVGLILAVAVVFAAIVLVAFIVSCIAIPASIWAGLELDAGREVRLRTAWLEGRARFGRYLGLALLKLAIGVLVLAAAAGFVAIGVAIYRAGGNATVALLVLGGLLLFLGLVAVLILINLGLTWSDRLLVILELGALDSVRASWWLFKRSKLDTVVFGIALWVVRAVLALVIAVVAGIAALPGIFLVVGAFQSSQASVWLLIAGLTWIFIVGGGIELAGAGFLGALTQVGYAMAARDLCFSRGLQGSPE